MTKTTFLSSIAPPLAIALIASLAMISNAKASEADCLASIIHAEARGESLEGAVAVGQATLNRAQRTGKPVCRVAGVKRATPPKTLIAYYRALAAQLIGDKSQSVVKNADSWNTGDTPRQPGAITRQIENHVFYVMKPEIE